ncbi:transforming growth factor beta receptor type 3-like isoform X2 [Artemia franciscana]
MTQKMDSRTHINLRGVGTVLSVLLARTVNIIHMLSLKMFGKGLTYLVTLLWSLTLVVGIFDDPFADANSPDLCVIHTPLETKYMSAWLNQRNVVANGCWGTVKPQDFLEEEIHILRVNHPLNEIELKLEGEWFTSSDGPPSKLIILLDSSSPLPWKIKGHSPVHNGRNVTLLVTGQSEVENSEIRVTVQKHSNVNQNADFSVLRFAKKRYGQITTYNSVEGTNKLVFTRGNNGNDAAICGSDHIPVLNSPSPVLSATVSEKKVLSGCYHKAEVGKLHTDLHIVNAQAPPKSTIEIHLSPELERGIENRNMTLILRSGHEDTIWAISASDRLHGFLRVMSKGIVENKGISKHFIIEAVKENFPQEFELFILEVALTITVPISYVNVSDVTSIDLVVGRKGPDILPGFSTGLNPWDTKNAASSGRKDERRNKINHKSRHKNGGQRFLPSKPYSGNARGLSQRVHEAIQLECEPKHMSASMPLDMGPIVGITFSDRTCKATRNRTHWILKSVVTSCGATVITDGRLTTYSNMVYVKVASNFISDDEDFEGSGFDNEDSPTASLMTGHSVTEIAVPHDCKYNPMLPLGSFIQESDDNVMDPSEDVPAQMELYHMEIYRDKDMKVPLKNTLIHNNQKNVEGSSFGLEVGYDETLHVKTWVDGVPYIQIVTEKCWIANSYEKKAAPKTTLIRNTCPSHLSVRMHSRSHTGGSSWFSFKMTPDYADMGLMYLHCKLGLCTTDPKTAHGNLKMCVNHREHCQNHSLKPFLEESVSTAQQIIVRGPILPVPRVSGSDNSKSNIDMGSERFENNSVPGAQFVLVGVSTEVAIGIAVISFLVGATLVAALWCIHAKTDPQRCRLRKEQRNSGFDLSAASGGSTPSSQTPIAT